MSKYATQISINCFVYPTTSPASLTVLPSFGIQVGSAVEDVHVHHNVIRRWAYVQKFGDANAIGMNPGSTGDVYNNWLEGRMRSTEHSEEYFGIV